MLCQHPPRDVRGSPAKSWEIPVSGEGGRGGGRRPWAAGSWRWPAPLRPKVRQIRHNAPVRPPRHRGQDLASSHSPGSLPSWTWGRGGSERGQRVSRSPGLALFINTTRYCMCPPFINRLFTPKDKTAPPDRPLALGGPSPLWGRHFAPGPWRIPSPTAPGKRALRGWGHGSRGLGVAGAPSNSCAGPAALCSHAVAAPRRRRNYSNCGPGPLVRGFSPPPRGNYGQFGAVEDVSLNRGGRRRPGEMGGRLGTPGRVGAGVTALHPQQPP